MSSKRINSRSEDRDQNHSSLVPVVIAVIGLIGTLVVAYFGYLGVRFQTEKPIEVTLTSEARLTQLSPTQALSFMNSSTPSLAARSTVTPTSPVSQTPSSVPIQSYEDSNLRISLDWDPRSCSGTFAKALPNYIDPQRRFSEARGQMLQAMVSGEFAEWSLAPDLNGWIPLFVEITSVRLGRDWIRLTNNIQISVTHLNIAPPNHTNTLQSGGGCGGGGIRVFSEVALESSVDRYSQNVVNDQFDYFALQPNEFELFLLPLRCVAPGVYRVKLIVPYTYSGQQETMSFELPQVVCPLALTTWDISAPFDPGETYDLLSTGNYTHVWDGMSYIYEGNS